MEEEIIKLREKYNTNFFENYKIEDEVKERLKKIFKTNNIYVSNLQTYPLVSINNLRFEFNKYQWHYYVDFSYPCYQGTSEIGLLKHNTERLKRYKEIEGIGKKLYKVLMGETLNTKTFNISQTLRKLED